MSNSESKAFSPYHLGLDHVVADSSAESVADALYLLLRIEDNYVRRRTNDPREAEYILRGLAEKQSVIILGVVNSLKLVGAIEDVRNVLTKPVFSNEFKALDEFKESQMIAEYKRNLAKGCTLSRSGTRVLISLLSGVPLSKVKHIGSGGTKSAYSLYINKGQKLVVRDWGGDYTDSGYLKSRISPDRIVKTESQASSLVGDSFAQKCKDIPFVPMDVSEYVMTEWEMYRYSNPDSDQDFWKILAESKKANPVLMSRGDDWGVALRETAERQFLLPVNIDFSHFSYMPNRSVEIDGRNIGKLAEKAKPIPIEICICPKQVSERLSLANSLTQK